MAGSQCWLNIYIISYRERVRYDSIFLECSATSLSEWCPTFYNHHTALTQWAPTTHSRRETSNMGQLLKVPSAIHLNCFFFSWMRTSEVSLHLGCLTIKWIQQVHGTSCTTSHRLLQRTQWDAQAILYTTMWNEALCNGYQQKTD
jgi:hypothetical protein